MPKKKKRHLLPAACGREVRVLVPTQGRPGGKRIRSLVLFLLLLHVLFRLPLLES